MKIEELRNKKLPEGYPLVYRVWLSDYLFSYIEINPPKAIVYNPELQDYQILLKEKLNELIEVKELEFRDLYLDSNDLDDYRVYIYYLARDIFSLEKEGFVRKGLIVNQDSLFLSKYNIEVTQDFVTGNSQEPLDEVYKEFLLEWVDIFFNIKSADSIESLNQIKQTLLRR